VFRSSGGPAVHVLGTGRVTARDLIVEGATNHGILLEGGAWGDVEDAIVRDTHLADVLDGCAVGVVNTSRLSAKRALLERNEGGGFCVETATVALVDIRVFDSVSVEAATLPNAGLRARNNSSARLARAHFARAFAHDVYCA